MLHDTPVYDFYNSNVHIMLNRCVPHTTDGWQAKPSSEARHHRDFFNLIDTVPTPNAYAPTGLFGCSLGTS